jgi:hypothetical protein
MLEYVVSHRRDGLGSRLIAVFVASRLAYQYDLKHYAVWKPNRWHCRADLNDILCNNRLLRCISEEPKLDDTRKFLGAVTRTRCMNTIAELGERYQTLHLSVVAPLVFANENEDDTKQCMADVTTNHLEWNYHVWQPAQAFLHQESLDDAIAVHVRRGDLHRHRGKKTGGHQKRLIPTKEYFRYIESNPLADRYMLFTENNETKEEFVQRYGKRIIVYPRARYGRNTQGIQQAMTEMILMSRCRHIIAGRSNFNLAASMMGNIPLTAMTYNWEKHQIHIDNPM